ncbi:hypothetical protein S245_031746 [Arachis hypogaea]
MTRATHWETELVESYSPTLCTSTTTVAFEQDLKPSSSFASQSPIILIIHLDLLMVLPSSLLIPTLKFLLNLLECFSAFLIMHLTELLLLNLILFPIPSLIPIIPTYNSAHKKLTVHVSTYLHTQPDTLTYDVDLSTKLPEKVKVGLSASTGRFSQNTEILSWIFKSN